MKSGTISHPKFARFKRALGLPVHSAIGILEGIWMLAAEYAEDGDLSKFTPQDIGDYLEYTDNPQRLIEVLVESRWLDSDGPGSLLIHDWFDHAPSYIGDRLRKRRERKSKAQELSEYSQPSRTVLDNPGKSVPTQPHPTQSNQITPHPTKPNLGRSSVGLSLDSFCWEWDKKSLEREADKFRKTSGLSKSRLSTNELALLVGFGLTVGQGFLGDLASRLDVGDVKQPTRYVKAAMRRWCEEHHVDSERISLRVSERLQQILGREAIA